MSILMKILLFRESFLLFSVTRLLVEYAEVGRTFLVKPPTPPLRKEGTMEILSNFTVEKQRVKIFHIHTKHPSECLKRLK